MRIDVDLVAPQILDDLAAVARLGHHLDVGLGLEKHAEPAAHERMIVRDEQPGSCPHRRR